jgi:tetratricopeptide (TPR) repeat protein
MSINMKYNPYDFSNPVSDPDLFIGRSNELEEIQYYLAQSRNAPRTVNLALIGSRASGKTSMLNMIEVEARKLDFCVARIDLDESDIDSQLAFFFKLIDTLLTVACRQGAFEGLNGNTYDIYRNMVDSYDIPEDKTFCPFVFPIQYARAMDKVNNNAIVSDIIIKQDLEIIYKELGKPTVILFDECDVLTKSRVHLQKLRNVFMNTAGYMLVFTGTQALFPLINDVFSPIIRQFKKINIGPFQKEQDTEECIRAPLLKVGVEDPEDIFDFETYQDVKDIHNLSNGRPYEIQLICHFLFKRIQMGRAKKMELSIDVLDDVLKELQATQDVLSRKILTNVRGLTDEQLKSLGVLCSCNGYATLEQIWFIEHVFDTSSSLEILREHLALFENIGILHVNDGIIGFNGDDFDKIYCKYLARKRDIFAYINDVPFEIWINAIVISHITESIDDARIIPVISVGTMSHINMQDVVENILADNDIDVFKSTPDLAETLYWTSIGNREKEVIHLAYITMMTPWIKARYCFTIDSEDISKTMEEINSYVDQLKLRAADLDSDVNITTEQIRLTNHRILIDKLKISGNNRLRKRIADAHIRFLSHEYYANDDVGEASFHAESAFLLSPSIDTMNNYGYISLVEDRLEQSEEILREALVKAEEVGNEQFQEALINYNLATLSAKRYSYEEALSLYDRAINIANGIAPSERLCGCLLLPRINGQHLDFPEVRSPDILDLAISARTEIANYLAIQRV